MSHHRDTETDTGRASGLSLPEFCDMEQLYRLIDNWSKSSGMYAVIVDNEGNRTSDSFGMTEFCKMVHDNEKGGAGCTATWKTDREGIYTCPIGFCDFSVPIVLPDGQMLGRVLAGQALSVNQEEEEIVRNTTALGIDEATVRDEPAHLQADPGGGADVLARGDSERLTRRRKHETYVRLRPEPLESQKRENKNDHSGMLPDTGGKL